LQNIQEGMNKRERWIFDLGFKPPYPRNAGKVAKWNRSVSNALIKIGAIQGLREVCDTFQIPYTNEDSSEAIYYRIITSEIVSSFEGGLTHFTESDLLLSDSELKSKVSDCIGGIEMRLPLLTHFGLPEFGGNRSEIARQIVRRFVAIRQAWEQEEHGVEQGITILPELQDHLLPLDDSEFDELEKNCLLNGILDPLKIWLHDGLKILVDGHNRKRIADRHGLPYSEKPIVFKDIDAVKLWMDQNQVGRRNLSDEHRKFVIGRMYSHMKQSKGGQIPGMRQNDAPMRTSELIAASVGESPRNVERHGSYFESLQTLSPVFDEAPLQISERFNSQKDVIRAAKLIEENPETPFEDLDAEYNLSKLRQDQARREKEREIETATKYDFIWVQDMSQDHVNDVSIHASDRCTVVATCQSQSVALVNALAKSAGLAYVDMAVMGGDSIEEVALFYKPKKCRENVKAGGIIKSDFDEYINGFGENALIL